MTATPDDELALLRDTARRIAAAHPLSSADADVPATAAAAWGALRRGGLDALRAEGDDGHAAADADQTCAVVEELARTLCPAPVLGSSVLAHELLRLAAADSSVVDDVVGDGATTVALTSALGRIADGAGSVDGVGVDAALARSALCRRGDELAVVPLGPPLPGIDPSRPLRPVAGPARGIGLRVDDAMMRRWEATALLALATDVLGAMSAVFDSAVAYAKTRVQFGKPIGSFQAVQHLCADAYVRIEAVRSAVLFAAWSAAYESEHDALLAATVAKAYAASTGPRVVQTAIQVFGGIAATWEHQAHLHLRRVLVDRMTLGDDAALKRRLLALRRAA